MMLSEHTIKLLIFLWIGIALILLPLQLKITVPYGRHSKNNWGLMISNRLGWFVMELPALAMFLFFVIRNGNFSNLFVIVASFLWVSHYFHRVIIYPLRIHTHGKKMPVLIMFSAFFFNMINGSINGYWIGKTDISFEAERWNLVLLIAGSMLFISGYFINQYHDQILIGLRKEGNGYHIPYGGLFRYESCPNFLGEIVEWIGFAILCHNLPSLAFLIWTLANLLPRALKHHQWYRKEFADYPKDRKALFPGIL